METFKPTVIYKWAKSVQDKSKGYEVSSFGDKRFSALNAKLSDGRTIEEAYQLDVKGYRKFGDLWKLGKGKAPLIPTTELPKLTLHYFELKSVAKFNIFEELTQLSNCCSKLICSDSTDTSIRHFIRIVKSEHSELVNPNDFDPEDIVLVLIDESTKDISLDDYNKALNSLYIAGSVSVLSFVTITRTGLSFTNFVDHVGKLISPRYREIPGTGYFVNLYEQYRNLWAQWASENINLFKELAILADGKTLTDVYASTDISQARALCDILNKYYKFI